MATKTRSKHSLESTKALPEGRAPRRNSPGARVVKQPVRLQEANAHPLLRHIVALAAIGWRVVELRPSIYEGEAELWYVTITRVDFGASLTVTEADPDVALAELVRYAQVDAE